MKKLRLAQALFIILLTGFRQPLRNDFDYTIIFSGPFKKDVVSMSINRQLVIDKYKVENVGAYNKGHLNLTQKENSITINYNGCQLQKPKVPVDFIIALNIFVNGQEKKINLDLRKGKVILINNPASGGKSSGKCVIQIEQLAEPFLFI